MAGLDFNVYLELEKLGVSKHRMAVPQTRTGRRSMRVDTLLKKDREGTLYRKHWHDQLPGGLADKKTPADFNPSALQQGRSVEKEHVRNPAIATEIAMDHLTEDPDYYDKLQKMEKESDVKEHIKNFEAKLRPGDILLTRALHPTLMSRIVSARQGSEFGHSSLYVGNGQVIDTRVDDGVFKTRLSEVATKWGGGRDIRAYRPKVSDEERKDAIERAKGYIGTPYDMKGALRLLLPASKDTGTSDEKKHAIICSQLITHAYPALHVAKDKNRDHVLPVDFAKSPLTTRVAELDHAKVAFKLQGHTSFQGLNISIENRKGSVRKGVDPDGKPWKTVFKIPYGYLTGTEGNDGEAIDVYVGPDKKAPNAFVVHQRKITGKGYDEDKLYLGFGNEEAVRNSYLQHYNSVGEKLLGPISTVTVDELKRILDTRRGKVKRIESLHTSEKPSAQKEP